MARRRSAGQQTETRQGVDMESKSLVWLDGRGTVDLEACWAYDDKDQLAGVLH
jgi:hypothetical protein